MEEEKEVLRKYIEKRGLRKTNQRYKVLEVFLSNEEHLSVDELYSLVEKKYPEISHSTVFRSMKVIFDAGLASKMMGCDSIIRYEHLYKHSQHGHMICSNCHKMIEFDDSKIEELLKKAAKKENFKAQIFKTRILGLCKKCAK
ncbi:MAG: Fur family transcriptional regulator [Elusimicrobiota bacterium]|nr:Fur family transcriptional regulator [Elusimicrobiota bacterium]